MLAEFGSVPICLELDFDSFDGPPHWVARLRQTSGWLLVAEATIQSEHDILTARLVVACDERENPIPSFKAANLLNCEWLNPTCCDELPPDILEDLICEEEGALISRWHREKNSALAEAFENSEKRIAELEGRVQFTIARNEARIVELRQRRRHPAATPDMRQAMAEVTRALDDENDELLAEMAATRSIIRERASAFEDTLWAKDDLLLETATTYLIRWNPRPARRTRLLVGTDRPSPWGSRSAIVVDPSSWEHRKLRCSESAGIMKPSPYDEKEFAASLQKRANSLPPTWDSLEYKSNGSPEHQEIYKNLARHSFKSNSKNGGRADIDIERFRQKKKIETQPISKNEIDASAQKQHVITLHGVPSSQVKIGKLDRAIEIETKRLRERVQRLRKSKLSKENKIDDAILDLHCIDRLKLDLSILENRWEVIHRDGQAGIAYAARLRAIEILLGELGANRPADRQSTSLVPRSIEQDEAQATPPTNGSAGASTEAPITRGPTPAPAAVQNALSALSAARKRYYGQD